MFWWWIFLINWIVGVDTFHSMDDSEIPAYWPELIHPKDNPQTESGIALGKRLFFDPILSRDSTISCASCHKPDLAFTDGLALSEGIEGRVGRRSAPSLLNVGFQHLGMFWDGRATNLETQSLHTITDSVEMDNDWETVLLRLHRHEDYLDLFGKAFGVLVISKNDIARAIAQYERSLISAGSRFDQMTSGAVNFTVSELRGWAIFFDASKDVPHGECSHCHAEPLFANPQFHNNGLIRNEDKGRAGVTNSRYDIGKFKVPSLRNVAITAPYMHDGRLKTLAEVVNHYALGGHGGINVSPNVRPLMLDEMDKRDLIAFLETLTDSVYVVGSNR